MLTPDQLDKIPDSLVELYSQAEADILANMCRRISNYDYFIPAAEWQFRKMTAMGNTYEDIIKKLSEMSGRSTYELEKLITEAGATALEFDDILYKKAGLNIVPIASSIALQNVLKEGMEKTSGLFRNLTGSTASAASRQLEIALDRAYMQITSGAFDSNTAIRNAVKFLASNGVAAAVYPNGNFKYIESAVRTAVLTGVNQTCCKLQEARADEVGSDLVEVTAHAGARTGEGVNNHAAWQGKIYSRSGRHSKYPDFVSSTGYGTGPGLGGWNCRHNFYPFIEGVSKPGYSNKQLKGYNAKRYTYDGEKITEYEATQRQRSIERQIRRWKREEIGMKAAGLPTDEAVAKIGKWQEIQKDFINQTGLKRQRDREAAGNISTKRFSQSEKERINYIKTIKPNEPKTIKSDNAELQFKIDYDIITKKGISMQGIVPSKTTLENVTVIAGYGTSTDIRAAKKLSESYGGDYWKWQKKSGIVESEYSKYEVHWYEYEGMQYEGKLKNWSEK